MKPFIKNSVINQSFCDNLPQFVDCIVNHLKNQVSALKSRREEFHRSGMNLYQPITTELEPSKNYLELSETQIQAQKGLKSILPLLQPVFSKVILARVFDAKNYYSLPCREFNSVYNTKSEMDKAIKSIFYEKQFAQQYESNPLNRRFP